jgi:hypothetical protein
MEYEVLATTLEEIDFTPKNETLEILQNIRTILTTSKYSVPLDREFGLSTTWLDEPLPVAQAKLSAEIIQQINKYEPRAKVKKISYETDGLNGKLIPKVVVVIEHSEQSS